MQKVKMQPSRHILEENVVEIENTIIFSEFITSFSDIHTIPTKIIRADNQYSIL